MPERMRTWEMPNEAAERPRFSLPFLVRAFALVLIGLSALSLFFVGSIASHKADELAFDKQLVLVDNAIRDRQSLMARDQLGLARWDRSVERIVLDFRQSYIEDEFVESLWHDFGHERSFLVGPGGRLLMTAWRDDVDFAERVLSKDEGLMQLVDLAIARHNTNRIAITGGFSQRPVQAARIHEIAAYGFVEIDGTPMIASAMAIVPDDGAVALPAGPPVVLVSAHPVDAVFINDLNAQLELPGIAFRINEDGLLQIFDVGNRMLGSFIWTVEKPGADIWSVVVPAVVLLCGLLLTASFVLGRYISRLSIRLEESERRNRELAHRDTLSGLANRLSFDRALNEAADRLAHAPFAVIAGDLDRFKAVNDQHGHAAGDAVIRTVAERLRSAVGAYGLVGRVGGDEFVILVDAFRDRPRLALLAQTILTSVSRPIMLPSGTLVDVGISLGIAVAPENGISAHAIMATADRSLYASKQGGRGRVFFAEDLDTANLHETDTRSADAANAA
ncbi:diguanylate cyclase [Rhizobium sp. AAP43]|uniref:diguanylate cyclase domain-containing protein n=1 Tax=Rhizobium sp. AAP43 TaxID=1523420 RepID=UPI0006B9CA03|nr:diguanylate cyclase [Rhizobium sp. AAP43]